MTDAEIKLWAVIRMKQLEGFQFYRQRIIGSYIIDFYCPKAKLVIEVDGSQHYESEQIEEDRKRDDYLKIRGFKVLRFNDNEVLTNIEGVLENILENIQD
jgi:very-short-patch-repair endonuclease